MSTPMKRLSFFFTVAIFLAGCATAHAAPEAATPTTGYTPGNNQYAPQPGDSALTVDTATFESTVVSQTGAQVQMDIAYRLPTPCHQVRVVVNPPDSSGQVNIKLYSVFEAGKPCALMPLATPLHAKLDLGKFPSGHYTIFVNDNKVEEFLEK